MSNTICEIINASSRLAAVKFVPQPLLERSFKIVYVNAFLLHPELDSQIVFSCQVFI